MYIYVLQDYSHKREDWFQYDYQMPHTASSIDHVSLNFSPNDSPLETMRNVFYFI